ESGLRAGDELESSKHLRFTNDEVTVLTGSPDYARRETVHRPYEPPGVSARATATSPTTTVCHPVYPESYTGRDDSSSSARPHEGPRGPIRVPCSASSLVRLDRYLTLLPPSYGAFLVAFRPASAPLAGARRQGRTPPISISNEKLRNVLITTIIPSTRTFSSVGATATVLIRSAATRISSPRSRAAPNACRSAVYARCCEPDRRQASTATTTDHTRPIVKISAPRASNAWAAYPI